MAKRKDNRRDPAYIREQGKLTTKHENKRKITFCFTKHIADQGQTMEEWEAQGLLAPLIQRTKFAGQFSAVEVRQNGCIKEYTKVDFPPNSEFICPNHIGVVTWAVMHVTNMSKEVVVGYIEDDVFYVVFLDKEHKFWPSVLKNT